MSIDIQEIREGLSLEYLSMGYEVQFVSDFMVSVGREAGQYRLPQEIISKILGDKFIASAQSKDSFTLSNITLNDAAVDNISRDSSSRPVTITFITKFLNQSEQNITVKVELTDSEFGELKGAIAAEIQRVLEEFKAALLEEAGKSVSRKRQLFRTVSEKVFDVNQLRGESIDVVLAYLYNQLRTNSVGISNTDELQDIISEYNGRIYKGRGMLRVNDFTVNQILKACNFVKRNSELVREL